MRAIRAHLDDVGETYGEHFGHALGFGTEMVLAGLACLVHAVLPFLFVKTGSACIGRLHDRMVVNRRNLTGSVRATGEAVTGSR